MAQHTCNNCGNTFEKGFCNQCGQKLAHRISMKHILHDISHALMHADKGIVHLFVQLFVRPGIVAREYIIDEKRKRYFNPFQYILIIGSIAAFVAVNSHFMEQMTKITIPGNASTRQLAFIDGIIKFQSKYYNMFVLLQLPFYALSSFLLYRRKHKLNYAEHLTLQTFVTAQTTVLGMLTMLIIWVGGKSVIYYSLIVSLLSAAFQVFAYVQFFNERSVKGFLKALASNILGFLFFLITIVLIVILAVIVFLLITKK